MTKPPIRLFQKQNKAWNYLQDNKHTEVAYWWGAGGGKSLLWSLWLATNIAAYPWSTWGIWRSELKKIKLSTFITFKQMLKDVGFSDDSWKYDDQKSVMTFTNWCMVVLMDLNDNPSDPEYDRLGSTEFSGFFIDEAQEVSGKAKQIVTSRLRNLTGETFYYSKNKEDAEKWIKDNWKWKLSYNEKLDEYQVVMWKLNKPKLLMTLNPWLNFVYTDFYKAQKDWNILPHRIFIQSLPTDNPFLPESYIDNLKNLDKVSKERLLYWNFEYSEEPWLLFDIDTLNWIFKPYKPHWREFYITIDVARLWKDSTEIAIWEWLHLIKIETIWKADLVTQSNIIKQYIKQYNVDINNVCVDETGLWGWLVDLLGSKWFIANASPIQPYSAKLLAYKKRNYQNLKTQAFFYLQKYIWEGKLTITADWTLKDRIIEELLFIRQIDLDNDGKIKLESKKDLKARLWRSPDLADTISIRMYYLIKEHANGQLSEEDILDTKTQSDIDNEQLLAFLMEDEEEEEKDFDLSVY